MKIAIIRKKYTFHGGAEGFSQNLLRNLADAGHEVHIYSIRWEDLAPSKNIFFHKVPAILFSSFLRDITFAVSSFFLLKRKRKFFDVIQSHDKTFSQDIYRAGDGCHIEWLNQRLRRKGTFEKLSIIFNPYHWLILYIERMIFKGRRFKKIIAISDLVRKNIIEHYGVDRKYIEVVYNGVDLERYRPQNRDIYRSEIRRGYSIDDDAFIVLFVGSGFERKGVEYLLKAAEDVPGPLTVLIVGKGSGKRYRSLIKRQNVIFCGPQIDIHKYYAASDVFVSPSIYEPFGNVHLEALASGLPVITTKLSGASEVIEEGRQGYVINEPEDTALMAEKITRLMDRDLNERMRLDARRLAERFSFDNHVRNMMDIYEGIIRDQSV